MNDAQNHVSVAKTNKKDAAPIEYADIRRMFSYNSANLSNLMI